MADVRTQGPGRIIMIIIVTTTTTIIIIQEKAGARGVARCEKTI